ncbi:MAG: tRNA (adenosine(37)-N6)-dimethylallyltransferase MiaA [Flavisolibacter sp.]
MIQKTAIIIAGPTASGKTSMAIDIALQLGTEIISADSRQCFRELNIGVARPSEEELQKVKHHFIASHSIHEKITAITFEQYALEKAKEIFRDHDHLVMAGGTGLYIKAFCEGMDEIPEVPDAIHREIVYEYKQHGLFWLQEQVKKLDPAFYAVAETDNPQRLMRALEVFKSTGQSIRDFRKGKKKQRDFQIRKIALQVPKEELHRRIDVRVEQMMERGLLREVESLLPYQHLNALQTVGYRELLDHMNGEISLQEAINRIKTNTRHYAKRQMTWFKKDGEYEWREAAS